MSDTWYKDNWHEEIAGLVREKQKCAEALTEAEEKMRMCQDEYEMATGAYYAAEAELRRAVEQLVLP